jgi:uncharacterized alpha-E superfamily protein
MLSRVAERIYWIGRHMERSENTARLLGVYAQLVLDLPKTIPLGWRALIEITGTQALFGEHYQHADERNVVKFLLADPTNPCSVLRSLELARENARTTREIMPSEVWEEINDAYWYLKDQVATATQRGNRHKLLSEIILSCQRLNGMLAGTMSHDSAYNFARLGRNLERADMTTRILDVGSTNGLSDPHGSEATLAASAMTAYENVLWMSVLRSLSAYQMYRQHVHNRVNGTDVAAFLLQDLYFPRSVMHCLNELEACLRQLPRSDAPLRSNARVQRRVAKADIPALLKNGLHLFIDDLQRELGNTHHQITGTWFEVQPAGGGEARVIRPQ